MDPHARLERLVADALTSADPLAGFERAARDPELPAELRAALQRASPLGIRLSALIVARLRFERLVQGSVAAAEWFARDPAGFTEAFRRYHVSVAPTGTTPGEEGKLFERWRRG
jgi:hypothetical protein